MFQLLRTHDVRVKDAVVLCVCEDYRNMLHVSISAYFFSFVTIFTTAVKSVLITDN